MLNKCINVIISFSFLVWLSPVTKLTVRGIPLLNREYESEEFLEKVLQLNAY